MKPRPIGLISGAGGPISACSILRDIIIECQNTYGSKRSYEFPAINFFSHPYSEMMLTDNISNSIPARELSYSIQQLKLVGMEIIVVPCFTMSSYLTCRSYGIELIEMAPLIKYYLSSNNISNPLVICSERTRKSKYCDKFFECTYPDDEIQREVNNLFESAYDGNILNLNDLAEKLPNDSHILCAASVLNAQSKDVTAPRWINANKVLAKHVAKRSFEGSLSEVNDGGYLTIQREMACAAV